MKFVSWLYNTDLFAILGRSQFGQVMMIGMHAMMMVSIDESMQIAILKGELIF